MDIFVPFLILCRVLSLRDIFFNSLVNSNVNTRIQRNTVYVAVKNDTCKLLHVYEALKSP